jgi:hypothetical protein
VDGVAHLELGGAQEFVVRFGGEQTGQGHQVGIAGLLEGLINAAGFGFLFGGQVGVHDSLVEEFVDAFDDPARLLDFPPTFETHTPQERIR